MLNSKPLAINLDLDKDYNKTFFDTGSIDEIDKRVKDLAKAWNQLTEEQRIYNRTSGEYTEVAKEIIAEYTRLTGARRSYAQTLKEIEQASKRGAKAVFDSLEIYCERSPAENCPVNYPPYFKGYFSPYFFSRLAYIRFIIHFFAELFLLPKI